MNKVRMGKNEPYNYRFIFNKYKYRDINLTSDLRLLNSQYTHQIDTLSLKYLKKIKLKDYNWLNNYVNKFDNIDFINFSKLFKNMYIVEIDSFNQIVVISKVERVYYED
jgi:hypothetical protein